MAYPPMWGSPLPYPPHYDILTGQKGGTIPSMKFSGKIFGKRGSVYLYYMKYSIHRDRLGKVFSNYMEKKFDNIRVDEYHNLVFGKPEDNTFLCGMKYMDGEFVLEVPYWSRVIKPLSNTFGEMWEQLLLDYYSDLLPEWLISKIVVEY